MPLLTPEQLAEFRLVNFATMEERAKAMREAGIFDPEEAVEQELDLLDGFVSYVTLGLSPRTSLF